jgi:methylated-DNA-[protein]-cysteine S-methyltransferase
MVEPRGRRWHAAVDTPVGRLYVVAREPLEAAVGEAIVAVRFDDPGPDAGDPAPRGSAPPVLVEALRQLAAYFGGARTTFDLPLAAQGTSFQKRVWAELARIPFGATSTYGGVARTIGDPAAVRAVGAANGANPIAIVVPCHRVVGASGRLVGYGGGLARKRWLLAHESGRTRLFDEQTLAVVDGGEKSKRRRHASR